MRRQRGLLCFIYSGTIDSSFIKSSDPFIQHIVTECLYMPSPVLGARHTKINEIRSFSWRALQYRGWSHGQLMTVWRMLFCSRGRSRWCVIPECVSQSLPSYQPVSAIPPGTLPCDLLLSSVDIVSPQVFVLLHISLIIFTAGCLVMSAITSFLIPKMFPCSCERWRVWKGCD